MKNALLRSASMKGNSMKQKYLIYGGIFLLGVWLGPKVAPSLQKVPVVGGIF